MDDNGTVDLEGPGSLVRDLCHQDITAKWTSITSPPAEDKLLKATLCDSENQRQSAQGSRRFFTTQAQGRKAQGEDIRLPSETVCGDFSHSLKNTKERRPYAYSRWMHSSQRASGWDP